MTYLDRILNNGTDRDSWLAAHRDHVTASQAQSLAKMSSIEKYLKRALEPKTFTGNEYTEQGHRWEPMMLAWANIPQNLALIHSPEHPGIAATVDGIGKTALAECKVKNNRIIDGPSLMEWRQLAIQMYCLPEFDSLEFIWVELDKSGEIRAGRNGEPCSLTIRRDHPKIVAATAQVLPIAVELSWRLHTALQAEKEMNAA